MKEFILGILRTKTVRQSGITFAGTFINGALGVVFYILMARYLGPEGFGIFSVSIAALTLVADISSLGTDTGIVRFVGKYVGEEREKALRFLKLALKVKLLVWVFVLVVGWLVIPWVSTNLLFKPELIFPLRLAMVGVGSGLLFSFTTNTLQAMQRFGLWSGLNISMNALRLGILGIFVYLGLLNTTLGLLNYILVPFLGFFIGFLFLPSFLGVKEENSVAQEFFTYNKWVALFTFLAAIAARLDTFLTTRLLSLTEVGIYSVAVSLAGIVPQVTYALGTVVAPKLAGFDTKEKAFNYLQKLQLLVGVLALLGLMTGIPLAYLVIPRFYGQAYVPALTPFVILILAQAIFLFSVPAHTAVIYYFAFPRLFVWISLVNLIIVGGLGYVLIGQYGYLGAAVTVLVGNISNFLIPAVWVIKKFKS